MGSIGFQKTYAEQGFTVIGISMDEGDRDGIKRFAEKNGVSYPILLNRNAVSNSLSRSDYRSPSWLIGMGGLQMSPWV